MDANDRRTIEDLFGRLGEAERQGGPRDAEAEALIRQRLAAQPAAPYCMAQTIVVQEHALRIAEARIAELEREAASRPSGGLLSGLFGGGRSGPPVAPPPGYPEQPTGGRSGFLASAAQTAAGVAGGVLLGNAVAGMLGAAAPAAVAPKDEFAGAFAGRQR